MRKKIHAGNMKYYVMDAEFNMTDEEIIRELINKYTQRWWNDAHDRTASWNKVQVLNELLEMMDV